ncbi:MAG: glycosyl hydrolase, partial [Acidobacteriota bacterium]
KGLLFAGTEFGLYVSFDDGRRWQPLQLNLPVTPVTDLAVHEKDLVVATQGRSFWILDDLSLLHQLDPTITSEPVHLFRPRDTVRFGGGFSFGRQGAGGQNPPTGVIIHYSLAEQPAEDQELILEILDEKDDLVRSLSSTKEERRAPNPFARFLPPGALGPKKLPAEKGSNRYVWDFRLPDATLLEDTVLWGTARGPRVPPGEYKVRLKRGDTVQTRVFAVRKDPRVSATRQELVAQFELAKKTWRAISESHHALKRIRDLRQQVDDIERRLNERKEGADLLVAAEAVRSKLSGIETALHQVKTESSQDALNFPPALDNQLVALMGTVESADARPTDGSLERYRELRDDLDAHLAALQGLIEHELAAFNDIVRGKNISGVIVPPAE